MAFLALRLEDRSNVFREGGLGGVAGRPGSDCGTRCHEERSEGQHADSEQRTDHDRLLSPAIVAPASLQAQTFQRHCTIECGVPERPIDLPPVRARRRRYPGRNPRAFHDKYKELNPERYPWDVEKVLASGRTPAGAHRPIMVDEVLRCLCPRAGEIAADCTLGGGGHARAILDRVRPGGRVIGLDIDRLELPRTEARLRAAGFGPDVFVARHANFAGLPKVHAAEGLTRVDLILADLGVSSMQFDNPDRGFSYKGVGPLDMRMNPLRGETAAQLVPRSSEEELERLLEENADEPHAQLIARLLKQQPLDTTHAVDRLLRAGLSAALPRLASADLKRSTRRTFQA